MEEDSGIRLSSLKVDGGACANNFLMQFQAGRHRRSGKKTRNDRNHRSWSRLSRRSGPQDYWENREEVIENWQVSRVSFEPADESSERRGGIAAAGMEKSSQYVPGVGEAVIIAD